MKIKEIRVYPSIWYLDVIVADNQKDLDYISKKRYGIKDDPILPNECSSIDSSKKSELKGERRVVISIKSLDDVETIVHELIYAIWHLARYIGYEIDYDTQEWQAVLYEYLYKEALDKNGYVKYKKK